MTREEHIIYVKNLRTALNMANNFSAETMESLDTAIKALEQEPKQGHWIERIERDEFDDYEEVFYKCSECEIEDCYKFTYCPHCGARMNEVSE